MAASPESPCRSPKTPKTPDSPSCSSERDSLAREDTTSDDEYFKPLKRLCMMHINPQVNAPPPPPPPPQQATPPPPSNKPFTSFSVRDILSSKPVKRTLSEPARIVRPWDLDDSERRRPRSADDDSRSDKSESDCPESPQCSSAAGASTSPLDALFEMTSKAFEGIEGNENSSDSSRDHLHIFSTRQQPKKKRKSRTAFTNHQIFELEKRFLYQKYLSPADRDEIAQSLGLTNAQVITWFQNRRAKLKRDMEELKKDVDATKVQTIHRNLMENIQDLSILKCELDKKASASVK